MNTTIDIAVGDIVPCREAVLAAVGVTPEDTPQAKIAGLADRARELFAGLARPAAVMDDISIADFEPIYLGQRRNEIPAPIEDIFPRAEHLALFALTVGRPVADRILALFDANEFALASLLDAAASEGADLASRLLEKATLENLQASGRGTPDTCVYAYSPGYCGWHISAQKNLFAVLKPETIGITLRESFLMEPLKSISGVLIAGPRRIHIFDNDYPFCGSCRSQPCRPRMDALRDDQT